MFEAAVTKFSKSVGDHVVIPPPNLDQSEYCRVSPLHIVVKKNRKWRWQSASYEPTPFSLNQILQEDEDLSLPVSSESAVTYNKIHKLSVKGKLGAKIKLLLDVELDGSDSVDVEAKFGNVNKLAVDETKLLTILGEKHLKTSYDFIKQVREHPRKVLCVVVACYQLDSSGSITAEKDISGEEKFGDEKLTKVVADANEDISVNTDNKNSMVVPPHTVVGYKVCELQVKSDLSIRLVVDSDSRGGFDEVDSAACCSAQLEDEGVDVMFKAIMTMESSQREKLLKAVLQICNYPKDVDTILVLTKQALALASETSAIGITKDTHLSLVKDKFLCPDQDWAPLLQMAGFSFYADGTVAYPKPGCVLLESVVNIFKSLAELDDDQLLAFSKVTEEFSRPLIYVLSQTLQGKALKTDDLDLCSLYVNSNAGQGLLNSLDFQVNNTGTILPPPASSEHQLQGASRALYALYWKREYDQHASQWCTVI